MDTRATRLRHAARNAVKQALEKENASLGTRSSGRRMMTGKFTGPTTRARGLSTVTNRVGSGPSRTAAKANVKPTTLVASTGIAKPKSFKSSIRKPPNWAAIHAKEEARKAKKMMAIKKPSTRSNDVRLHSDSRTRAARAGDTVDDASSSGIPIPKFKGKAGRAVEPTAMQTEDDGFSADTSALNSILSNTGVRQPGASQMSHRMTMATSTLSSRTNALSVLNRGHEEGLKNATKAIERLHLKRASMYAGPRGVARQQMLQQEQKPAPAPAPVPVSVPTRQSMYVGAAMRQRNTGREGGFGAQEGAAAIIIQRDARNLPITPGRGAIGGFGRFGGGVPSESAQPSQLQQLVMDDGFGDDGFQTNEGALESIMSNTGVEVIADKKMRASVYHGPMRVANKGKKKVTAAKDGATFATPSKYAPTTPSRYAHQHTEVATTPKSAVRRFTMSGLTPRNRAAPRSAIRGNAPASSQKMVLMNTPGRSMFAEKPYSRGVDSGHGGGTNLDFGSGVGLQFPSYEDPEHRLSNVSAQQTKAALEAVRQEELELERELEREMLAESIVVPAMDAMDGAPTIAPPTATPAAVGFVRPASFVAGPVAFGVKPIAAGFVVPAGFVTRPVVTVPQAVAAVTQPKTVVTATTQPFETAFRDEINTELITINAGKMLSDDGGRQFDNPMLDSIVYKPKAFEFRPIIETAPVHSIAMGGSAFRKATIAER